MLKASRSVVIQKAAEYSAEMPYAFTFMTKIGIPTNSRFEVLATQTEASSDLPWSRL